jgi:DNA-binding NtrC family response regulator
VLTEYRWPGNVREMAAVMDRAVLIGQGRVLDVAAALGRPGVAATAPSVRVKETPAAAAHSVEIEPLEVVIRRHIELALRASHGRVEGRYGAARLLQMNPHTLWSRMRKLRIDRRAFRGE